jgi:CelD/BcsL family acetyltransferase involved in cellulose biosynthesis
VITSSGKLLSRADLSTVELVDHLDSLSEDWTRLAEAAGNIFATWEWSELWWRHHGRGRRLRIALLRREGELEAIVPLFLWSGPPVRTLRLIGHGHGDRLGPICRRDDAETTTRAMRLALDAERHDVFVGDWVAGDLEWASALGGRVVRSTGYPILRFRHDSWDEFLAARSYRFRKNLRNRRNRLMRNREVSYRYADSATLDADLDVAFHLHSARFGVHRGCDFCGQHEPFQRAFARVALEHGWLRLLLLEVDGAPVSCEYGFLFENAYFAYQGGRDPAWDRASVGFLLEVESIRRILAEGAHEYRFLGGEEDYKYRWPTEDPGLQTIVAPASQWGSVAAAAVDAAWRLPGGKAALRRLAGARASAARA